MDAELMLIIDEIYKGDLCGPPVVGPGVTRADIAVLAVLRANETRRQLYWLIEAAVGGGMPVDVPVYVEREYGGDWTKAVKFACEAIAVYQGRKSRPAGQRGTTVSDPDRRGV
jgi:hypothetical protein